MTTTDKPVEVERVAPNYAFESGASGAGWTLKRQFVVILTKLPGSRKLESFN
jgi:hypothetical protein